MKRLSLILIVFTLMMVSCRKEDAPITLGPDPTTGIKPSSAQATLLQQMAQKDGSEDNIIDLASCFTVKLPVTVIANGQQITVSSPTNYIDIEVIFDASDIDTDTLEIVFPITIILQDFTEVVIASQSELSTYASGCGVENAPDDDIECADILYPVTVTVLENEFPSTLVITNDKDLFDLIDDLDKYDSVEIKFPIAVQLSDGSVVQTNNLSELEVVLENAKDACDEDDDNDYNDDDCYDCSPQEVLDVLTSCTDWYVDKLEVSDIDLEDLYISFNFNFNSDGTVDVTYPLGTYSGTWSSATNGSVIEFNLSIPGLDDFLGPWEVHDINEGSETQVDLRTPSDNRLRFRSSCGN